MGEDVASVSELRLVLTVRDVDAALRLYRDILLALPTPTPWGSRNARFGAPGGVQLTLFGP
jgi:hypothetical protein